MKIKKDIIRMILSNLISIELKHEKLAYIQSKAFADYLSEEIIKKLEEQT